MELLVATLQDSGPYGLYQIGNCSGQQRKDIRSVTSESLVFCQAATKRDFVSDFSGASSFSSLVFAKQA